MGVFGRTYKLLRLLYPSSGPRYSFARLSTTKEPVDGSEIDEPDILLKKVVLEVKGHEPAVLKSYERFVKSVCGYFDLKCDVETRYSPLYDRLSLNKSPFIHKKHQRQYEFQTFIKNFTIPHLTGCTASVFVEYIQRNLPAGVHMTVKQHRVEPLPDAIQNSLCEKEKASN